MKITENRETPAPPPVKSYTLELTPDQMRMLRYFAAEAAAAPALGATAANFLDKTSHLEAANLPINWKTRF